MATTAQMNANKKYQGKLDRVTFYVNKGQKEKIRLRAKSLEISMNAYIVSLIDKDMDEGQK